MEILDTQPFNCPLPKGTKNARYKPLDAFRFTLPDTLQTPLPMTSDSIPKEVHYGCYGRYRYRREAHFNKRFLMGIYTVNGEGVLRMGLLMTALHVLMRKEVFLKPDCGGGLSQEIRQTYIHKHDLGMTDTNIAFLYQRRGTAKSKRERFCTIA